MTELEIFLATALTQILDLHDNPVQRCDCKQCKIAWQSLAAAKLTSLISKDERDKIVLQAVKDNSNDKT